MPSWSLCGVCHAADHIGHWTLLFVLNLQGNGLDGPRSLDYSDEELGRARPMPSVRAETEPVTLRLRDKADARAGRRQMMARSSLTARKRPHVYQTVREHSRASSDSLASKVRVNFAQPLTSLQYL